MDATHATAADERLEDPNFGKATGGKVAMWIFIAQDGMAFGGLLLAYALMRIYAPHWPAEGMKPTQVLGIGLTAFATFVLICSSLTMVMAVQASQQARRAATVRWLLATIAGGLTFLGIQAFEYTHLAHEGVGLTQATFDGHVLHHAALAAAG